MVYLKMLLTATINMIDKLKMILSVIKNVILIHKGINKTNH